MAAFGQPEAPNKGGQACANTRWALRLADLNLTVNCDVMPLDYIFSYFSAFEPKDSVRHLPNT